MHCAAITSPSRNVLEATQAQHDLPPIPQVVIANPIPLADPVPLETMAESARQSLLFVGRFDLHKGGDVVIDAFEQLAQTHPTCRLTFAGPDRGVMQADGRKEHIQDRLERLPDAIRERIDYLGPCSAQEVTQLRMRHGITLIASRYENFNYTMLEALACGSAMIAPDVGGPREVLSDGQTALLVPPADPKALAAACARLLDNPDEALRLALAARAHAGAHFTPAQVGQQMADFLAELAAERS